MNEININGTIYVPKSSQKAMAKPRNKMKYVIARTYSAGVFAGYLESRNGREVVMRDARRIWYWEGANSLSQLAIDGTKCPDKCKFPEAVEQVLLLQAIEILRVSPTAEKSIREVPIWKQ